MQQRSNRTDQSSKSGPISGRHARGFTIVELLIVIVVIGILAAITIVAYNGIQARAKDSRTESELGAIKKALALYQIDNGTYPNPCGADNVGCSASGLSAWLVPTYVAQFPSNPDLFQYVKGSTDAYAIYVRYDSKADCKSGVNVASGWWGAGLPTC